MGQFLRVSAAMHVLFHLGNEAEIPDTITQSAIEAGIDFVEVCCQHTAYITGRGSIDHELELAEAGKHCEEVHYITQSIILQFTFFRSIYKEPKK